MADVLTTPRIIDPGTIVLRDETYKIKGPVSVVMSSQFPTKRVIGDYGRDDNTHISTYTITDIRGGMGLWRYRDTKSELNRFWTAVTVNGLFPNSTTMGPLATSKGTPVAGSEHTAYGSLLGKDVATINSNIYRIPSAATWAAAVDTIVGTARDTLVFNGRIFYFQGLDGYAYQTDGDGLATDVSTPTVISGTIFDNNLYVIDASGPPVLFRSPTGDSGSWKTLASIPGLDSIASPYNLSLVVYVNASGDPTLWCCTEFGAYIYDVDNDKWSKVLDKPPSASGLAASFAARIGAVYNGSLYMISNKMNVLKMTMRDNALIVEDVGPNLEFGLDTATYYNPVIVSLESDDRLLYALTSRSTINNNGVTVLLAYNGLGWFPIYRNVHNTTRASLALKIIVGAPSASTNRLYFADVSGTDTITRWINLTEFYQPPVLTTTQEYGASTIIEYPYFDADYPGQQKNALKVRVKLTGASATEGVRIAYRIDGSTGAYTLMSSAITSDAENVQYFGTNNEGLAFKSIQLRASLAALGDSTVAPKIEYIQLEFERLPETLRGFSATIDCRDYFANRSPAEQIDDLWTILGTNTLVTFGYRDDNGNTRSYLVRAMSPEGVEGTGYEESGLYKLLLLEKSNP